MIWPDVIATGIVAALGGTLVVPSARRFVLGEVKHDWLQDELDLDHIADDGATVVNKDGAHTRAWHLRGLSYDAKVEQEQHALLLGRQALLHQLGGKGLQLRFLAVKRRRPLHCAGDWPHPTLTEIGTAETVRYQSSYEVDWYLIATGRWSHVLADADQIIHASLSAYRPVPVTRPDDPGAPCPLTGLLNGLVCGEYRRDLGPQARTLAGALPACDLRFAPSGLVHTEGSTSTVHRIIGIREWPETVSGRIIGDLLALDGDLEIAQVCDPWNRDKALAMYKRQEQTQRTALLMHLLGGLAKFEKVRSYIFDSKEGTRFMVEAMGGAYQSYDALALNPLDVGEDTAANRNRIYAILRSLCGGLSLAPEDKEALNHAVDIAMHLEPPHRTLNEIFNHAFARRSTLRRHFAQWVVDDKGNRGMHSHVFNAPQDSLAGVLNHYMVGINMNEALDDPELGPPVVAHIASAIGKTAAHTSRGFAIFIDEAAKLLQNNGFLDLAVEMFREYRKLNGVVGLAFQDPAALFKTGRADAFVESCATLIFLPNANAKAETFAPFGLNDEQLAFCLGQTVTAGRRQALVVKRDSATGFDQSAILDIDLSFLGNALRFYRSGVDANAALSHLKETWGDQWHHHL